MQDPNEQLDRTRHANPETEVSHPTELLYQRQEAPTMPAPPVRGSYQAQTAARMPHVTTRRSNRRQNVMGFCLAITGAFTAFGLVASVVLAMLAPSIYRNQRPEIQSIWCSRAERVRMNFVCDWKPTPPFETVPTLSGPTPDPNDILLLLTPATATPGGSSGGTGGGSAATSTPTAGATEASALLPAATATLTPTPTLTVTPSPSPTATLMPTATAQPIPASFKLDVNRLRQEYQGWNNCGPTTLTMGLSYFGYANNQYPAANFLKPNGEDKNVSPYQMVNYVNQRASQQINVRAMARIGGTMELAKRLIANNFPIIIEKGYEVADVEGWMGHYLLLMGYDDSQQTFYAYDSYLGAGTAVGSGHAGRQESYEKTERYWKQFNYMFIVIYDPLREQELMNLLGSIADPAAAAQAALEVARQQAAVNPSDNWAWFNLGDAYTHLGDYERAAQAFDQAFALGMPWRTLWYLHTPYIAYFAEGRYQDIIARTQATESTTPYVEETFFYRGAVYAAQGDVQNAIRQFNQALSYNSNFTAAQTALAAVQSGTFTPDLILQAPVGG